MGLRELIKNASTESEVLSLLSSGTNYKFASDRTRRSWKSTARCRISELYNPIPAQEPVFFKVTQGKKEGLVSKKKRKS